MSSTERAPEPTMEEILASIRRIIADDESNSTKQQAVPQGQDDDEALELFEDAVDDKIINDIARVLSGGAPAPVADEEEDILDLTAELGGLEPVEESQPQEAAADEEVVALEETEIVPFEAPQSEPVFRPAPAAPEVAVADAEAPEAASSKAQTPDPEPDAEPAEAPLPQSASEEAASALERAIAALRAGQLPTSPIFSYEPSPLAQPEPVPTSPPAFVAESATAPASASVPEHELAAEPALEPEPELVLTEFEAEMIGEEPVMVDVVVAEPEAAEAPAWGSEARSWDEPEDREAEREPSSNGTNGGNHQTYAVTSGGEAGPKTLEDSIKDMLRPMLQQWLEENMARVLTAALKDEIKHNPARFQGD